MLEEFVLLYRAEIFICFLDLSTNSNVEGTTFNPNPQIGEVTEKDWTSLEADNKWNETTNKSNEDGLVNRIDGSLIGVNRGRDKCVCAPDGHVL